MGNVNWQNLACSGSQNAPYAGGLSLAVSSVSMFFGLQLVCTVDTHQLSFHRSPKSDESASHREAEFHKRRHTTNVTLEMRRLWNMTRRVDVGRQVWILDIGQSPLSIDVLVIIINRHLKISS